MKPMLYVCLYVFIFYVLYHMIIKQDEKQTNTFDYFGAVGWVVEVLTELLTPILA